MMKQQMADKQLNNEIKFELSYYFPCSIYTINRPEFIDVVNEVSEEHLDISHNQHGMSDIYPVVMSGNYSNDSRLNQFCEFIGASSWNILNEQGYNMDNFGIVFESMWTQEHHRQSSMEQHVHGYGVQLVGFYFLEAPSGSSRLVFHDPRPGKVMANLPERDMRNLTPASQMINFEPKAGMMVITNSWLPHSFTRNSSYKPLKFVHFNISLAYNEQVQQAFPENQKICISPLTEVI